MTGSVVYVDSSALLKLIFDEPETDALREFLRHSPALVSSMLARIELARVVAQAEDAEAERELRLVLKGLNLVRIDDDIVGAAASMTAPLLRSLDAIHLATAQLFGPHLAGMVAYDKRLSAAARGLGITVWSPG